METNVSDKEAMICKSCKKAGEFNAVANTVDGILADLAREDAVVRHAECPGDTWCDCQHVIDRVLNIPRTR